VHWLCAYAVAGRFRVHDLVDYRHCVAVDRDTEETTSTAIPKCCAAADSLTDERLDATASRLGVCGTDLFLFQLGLE